jgi:ABC-type protease/lipase transport system fused ATPase/permease subunit
MPPRQIKGPIYPEHSELAAASASCRGAFLATGLISGMSNVLMLTGAMFMLEIYDASAEIRYLRP